MKDEFRKRSKSTSAKPDVRLAVAGAPRVGKSAISVRFLTRRFIGEYQRNVERIYRRNIQFGNDIIEYDLKDISGVIVDKNSILNWATCIAVIYSITDRSSYNSATTLLDEIDSIIHEYDDPYHALTPCIALIGNKKDLDHFREVPHAEGRDLAKKYGAGFYEVSASEDYYSTHKPLNSLIVESYLNAVTARNTDNNSSSQPSSAPTSAKGHAESKPRAKSENLSSNQPQFIIDSELEDFEERKNFFKKQEEDSISVTSFKEIKKRNKKQNWEIIRKNLDLKLEENNPRMKKISVGKFSLDNYTLNESSLGSITPDPRNESFMFLGEEVCHNGLSRKEKKRSSFRKNNENKPKELMDTSFIKSKSYSDLQSYVNEQKDKKDNFEPQLSRVKKLANEIDKHGGYKDRDIEQSSIDTPAALLSPGIKPQTASFTNLSLSLPSDDQVKKPNTAPKPKRVRRKTIASSPTDENGNAISFPEKKSPENETKIPMKLRRSEHKKSVRRKLSQIFRPKIVLETA